jgi:hypothetical protein
LVATVSYLILFFGVICFGDWSKDMTGFAVSNIVFLSASVFYAWLVFRVFKEIGNGDQTTLSRFLVVFDLFVVAGSSISMAAFLYLDNQPTSAIVPSALLAFHCTVLDALIWGYTWSFQETESGVYHSINELWHFRASLDNDPSTLSIFSRLRIRACDYGTV